MMMVWLRRASSRLCHLGKNSKRFGHSVFNSNSPLDESYKYKVDELMTTIHEKIFAEKDITILRRLSEGDKISKELTIKQYKAILRLNSKGLDFPSHMVPKDLTIVPKRGAVKHLTKPLRKKGGRNSTGRITVRHRGGGFKRRLRLLDVKRDAATEPQKVIRIEHDPNRSAKIALVQEIHSRKLSYLLPPVGLLPNDIISNDHSPSLGNHLPLSEIPVGSYIYNIETRPGSGAKLVRSAGVKAKYAGIDSSGKYGIIELPSKKTKTILLNCKATLGQVNNTEWYHRIIGKAGRNRNLGIRPTVRGVAMNPVDHPHGGGKGGKSKGHHSQSPWGKICK